VLALMPYGEDDDWLLSLPLFHVSGQGILWRWLQAGARLTVREKQPLAQALRGCTHASLVPTQLWRLLNTHQPVALKAVLLGGAAIPVELTQQAREQGSHLLRLRPDRVCLYRLRESGGRRAGRSYALPGREVQVLTVKSGSGQRAWPQATGGTANWFR
jgi:O-succinylbenzoic acid--CoA ligase